MKISYFLFSLIQEFSLNPNDFLQLNVATAGISWIFREKALFINTFLIELYLFVENLPHILHR